jgi:hypothetical protein
VLGKVPPVVAVWNQTFGWRFVVVDVDPTLDGLGVTATGDGAALSSIQRVAAAALLVGVEDFKISVGDRKEITDHTRGP